MEEPSVWISTRLCRRNIQDINGSSDHEPCLIKEQDVYWDHSFSWDHPKYGPKDTPVIVPTFLNPIVTVPWHLPPKQSCFSLKKKSHSWQWRNKKSKSPTWTLWVGNLVAWLSEKKVLQWKWVKGSTPNGATSPSFI